MDVGFWAGIVAMIFYGMADVLTAVALKYDEVAKVLLLGSLVVMLMFLPILFYLLPSLQFNAYYALLTVVAGVIGSLALFAYFRGLQVDRVSMVAPISSAWPIITIPLAVFLLAQGLDPIEILGAALIVLGSIIIALRFQQLKRLKSFSAMKGIKYGLLTMVIWGFMYWLVGYSSKDMGWFITIFIFGLVQTVLFLLYFMYKRTPMQISHKAVAPIIGEAVLNGVAILAFGFGSQYGNISIISPLTAAAPLVAVLLAYTFLKEKLSGNEKFGVVLLIVGTVLLSF